jgi:hypothetical protein
MKTIYCLKKSGVVFYVGATGRMSKRISEHHNKWGFDVDFVVLEIVDETIALTREIYWINQFPSLANVAHTPKTGSGVNGLDGLPKAHIAKRNFRKIK